MQVSRVKKSILYYKTILVILVTDFVCPMTLQQLVPSLLLVSSTFRFHKYFACHTERVNTGKNELKSKNA